MEVSFGAGAKEDTTLFHFRLNDGFVNEEEGGRVGSHQAEIAQNRVDSFTDLQKCNPNEVQYEK